VFITYARDTLLALKTWQQCGPSWLFFRCWKSEALETLYKNVSLI